MGGSDKKRRRKSSQKTPEQSVPKKRILDSQTTDRSVQKSISDYINPTQEKVNMESDTNDTSKLELNMEKTMEMITKAVEKSLEKFELNTLKNELKEIHEIKNEMKDIKEAVECSFSRSEEALKVTEQFRSETIELKQKVACLEDTLEKERKLRVQLECDLRRQNLKIYGIEEQIYNESTGDNRSQVENTSEVVKKVLEQRLNLQNIEVDIAYRLGPMKTKSGVKQIPRPILLKTKSLNDRNRIWANRRSLKGTNIYLKEDLPIEMEEKIKQLTPIMLEARKQDMKAIIIKDSLKINGEKYSVETLNRLPDCLQPKTIATKEMDKNILFWGKMSPFSNFNTDYTFTKDGCTFNCGEQFYCHAKAKFFDDLVAADKILAEFDPKKQKRTPIQGFSKEKWSKVQIEYMKEGLLQRYSQNNDLLAQLRQTKGCCLYEASPYDREWGIGVKQSELNINDKSKWGQNLLGKALMDIRDLLCGSE